MQEVLRLDQLGMIDSMIWLEAWEHQVEPQVMQGLIDDSDSLEGD